MADFLEEMLLHIIKLISFAGMFKLPLMPETGSSKLTEAMLILSRSGETNLNEPSKNV